MEDDNKKEDEENEDIECNFMLRNYQADILEIAKNQNSILFLPTGSGKTLLAIHVLLSISQDIVGSFAEGSKRAFFLNNTKVMVYQNGKVLRTHTKLKIGCYTGDMSVDFWNKSKWQEEFEKYNVIVLTGEILRQIIELKFISPSQIRFLLVDECHHATSNHPYKIVMDNLGTLDPSESPLILGLSAVLLKSVSSAGQVKASIQNLEKNFRSKVITHENSAEVLRFSANPIQKVVVFNDDYTPSYDGVLQIFDIAIDTLNSVFILPSDSVTIPDGGVDFKNKNRARKIRNCFAMGKKILQTLGAFCGALASLFYTIYFEKLSLLSHDKSEVLILMYARTEITKVRHLLVRTIGDDENMAAIYKFSSPKVQTLLDLIRERSNSNYIVFVQDKAQAIILAYLFKRLALNEEEFSNIKADFIIGVSSLDSESTFSIKDNIEILKGFACGDLNLLVATNILEEGIDLSACDTVISFDFPLGYASYFQSKGRARSRNSLYCLFVGNSEVKKLGDKLRTYQEIHGEIQKVLTNSEEDDDDSNSSFEFIERIGIMRKSDYIEIDALTAIKIVYRYIQSLPQDKFSCLAPVIWHKLVKNNQRQGFLQLPMASPVRQIIEGEPRPRIKLAKRSVFLKTAKTLYEAGELDENFYSLKYEVKSVNYEFLFPHYKKEIIDKNLPQPGTKKRIEIYDIKFPDLLSNCLPCPGVLIYLHVISFNVSFEKPTSRHKVTLYEILQDSCTYGIISTKKLDKICGFPLCLSMGRIYCELLENYDKFYLTESELNDIKIFHIALFKKVIGISKNAQVFDNRNKGLSFFVVPVDLNQEMNYTLNWDLIRCDYCRDTDTALVRYNPTSTYRTGAHLKRTQDDLPIKTDSEKFDSLLLYNSSDRRSDVHELNEEKPKFVFSEVDFKYFVLIPSYRCQDSPQFYVLSKICYNLTPFSPFPNDQFSTYCSYYKEKYNLDVTNPDQPLLQVNPVFKSASFNKLSPPKPKARDRIKGFEEIFIPEFCDVVPFLRQYWVKAMLLSSVLYRIAQMYNAEEFRKYIAYSSGLKEVNLPENLSWKRLDPDECFCEDEVDNFPFQLNTFESSLPLSQLKRKTWIDDAKPFVDPDRLIYQVGVVDLEYIVQKFQTSDLDKITNEYNLLEKNDEVIKLKSSVNSEVPYLKIFDNRRTGFGPELSDIIRASTAKSANDFVDYERLEILGDSFLKFSVSLFLFKSCPENEGILTFLKGKMVGNRNLLYCGLAKKFQNVINVIDFEPLSDWNPPLLYIHERLAECIVSNSADPAVIYQFNISHDEQLSGNLSEKTLLENKKIIQNYERTCEKSMCPLLPYKAIKDKVIADCVEAFIGLYLETLGPPGAFTFLTWMDILPKNKHHYFELIESEYKTEVPDFVHCNVINLLSKVYYTDLESTLGYTFKNKLLLLEALTHPSYISNRMTDSYQRLEFLGDAVLDFLITTYLYENFKNLTPGKVTDIRSSLVNNITFGCLTVRYELHKHLLFLNSSLNKAIENFVSFQLSRNHLVDENVLVLLEERDCLMAESVQVPKALGDVFESLAGAIFLDSKNSLETVWRIYYRMMKKEIETFTKTIPKNSVRLLTEICNDNPYYEVMVNRDFVKVACTIYYNNYEITTHGFGHNKKVAKLSAAKLALKKIMEIKTA